jgi:hypothetical protein
VVVEQFMAAAAGGDLGALMAVLDPNVSGRHTGDPIGLANASP